MSKTDSATGIYFWPYDIFGYFLPGVVVLAPLTQFHTDVRAIVVTRFQEASLVDIAVLCIAAYVLGHIVAAVSSWFFELTILKFSFGYPVTQQLCGYESGTLLRRTIGKGTVLHEHWPFTWFQNRFGFHWLYRLSRGFSQNCGPLFDVIPGFVHPYDDEYRKAIEKKFERLCAVEYVDWAINRRSHDLFWTIHAYSMENMPAVYRSSMHFVELYGFSRNTSMAFLIVAFYPFCPDWDTSINGSKPINMWVWLTFCGIASLVMYINFVKLLRRQNDLLLRSFVANANVDLPTKHLRATSDAVNP